MLKRLPDPANVAEVASKPRSVPGRPTKFYTVTQVAEILGVSTRTVRRWIADRELAVHRFGSALRISEADMRVFLALHRED